MTSYDYKTLRPDGPLRSTQTQTLLKLWVEKCFSRQASNSDELAKKKTFKTGTLFIKKLLTV